MKMVNVLIAVADKEGQALIPSLFFDGEEGLTAELNNARTYRKLGSAVMKTHYKKVIKLFPGYVVNEATVNLEPSGDIVDGRQTHDQSEATEVDTQEIEQRVADEITEAIPTQKGGTVESVKEEAEKEESIEELSDNLKEEIETLEEMQDEVDRQDAEDESDDEEVKETMSSHLEKYRKEYVDSISSSGKKSKISGDEISLAMVGLTPEEVMASAEAILGLKPDELLNRYLHLNPGQKRMNAGNGIRAALKRGDITMDEIEKGLANTVKH